MRARPAAHADILARIRDEWGAERLALADRYAELQASQLDYVKAWRAAGMPIGDDLHRAACYQRQADELDRLFSFAVSVGATPEHLCDLLDDLEHTWERAHRAYVAEGPRLHVA